MTEASKRSRSVYVAARAKCRNAGLNMASAQAVIDAFNQLDMFSLQDAAERCLLEEVKAGGAKESKGGETKGESADSKQPGTIGGQLLATVVAGALPSDAKSLALNADDAGEVPSLKTIISRLLTTALEEARLNKTRGFDGQPLAASAGGAGAAGDRKGSGLDDAEPSKSLPMAEYLRSLLDNPDWSDVTLRVGKHTIRAMKGLLARSPYFRAMFNPKSKFSESKQGEVEIKGVEFADFKMLLSYLYTDAIPQTVVSPQHSLKLFLLADQYQLPALAEAAANLFSETLDVDNVEESFLLSLSPGHDLLKQQCLAYINRHFQAVMDATDGFARTEKEAPTALRQVLMAKHPVRKRGRGQNGGVIAFGSVIRLRHHTTNRYLVTGNRSYSHAGTSGQRQVWAITEPSAECDWLVMAEHNGGAGSGDVKNGSMIRLEHVASKHMLHSHVATSPATGQQEVTTYPHHDSNDNWEVVVSEPLWQAGAQLRLMHDETQHRLHSHTSQFTSRPGEQQQEVTAYPHGDDNDIWIAEIPDAF